jgi:hypothetical protein
LDRPPLLGFHLIIVVIELAERVHRCQHRDLRSRWPTVGKYDVLNVGPLEPTQARPVALWRCAQLTFKQAA